MLSLRQASLAGRRLARGSSSVHSESHNQICHYSHITDSPIQKCQFREPSEIMGHTLQADVKKALQRSVMELQEITHLCVRSLAVQSLKIKDIFPNLNFRGSSFIIRIGHFRGPVLLVSLITTSGTPFTVAILAQGTSWAVADTQAFFASELASSHEPCDWFSSTSLQSPALHSCSRLPYCSVPHHLHASSENRLMKEETPLRILSSMR